MPASMTGFGRGVVRQGSTRYVAEVKSVNNRFCEVRIFAPKDLFELEHKLTTKVRDSFERGKFDLLIKAESATKKRGTKDTSHWIERWKQLESVRKKLKLKEPVRLEAAIAASVGESAGGRGPLDEKQFLRAAQKALSNLNVFRAKEGERLTKDIRHRTEKIGLWMKEVEEAIEGGVAKRFEKLKERVATLFEGKNLDSGRLETELAILADKMDVTEEIVRLRSHFKSLSETAKSKGSVGRKLEFILQEIHREVNTIGSKCSESKVIETIVKIKTEIERIREQVQNLE